MSDVWDPHGSLKRALWIGGAQWSGKTTVAELIARKHGLTVYHYDYHDARGHQDRRIARRVALGEPVEDPTPDHVWSDQSPEEMAAETLAGFPVRFEWALDDLRALFTGRPAIAEGWGLRPELVAPLLDSLRRMVVLVPTEDFRQHQLRTLPRAGTLNVPVTDPARSRDARRGGCGGRGRRAFRPLPWRGDGCVIARPKRFSLLIASTLPNSRHVGRRPGRSDTAGATPAVSNGVAPTPQARGPLLVRQPRLGLRPPRPCHGTSLPT
ncbi:hypothetical protein [Streptomyces mirabilis]